MYVCTYVCMHVRMYVCMHACMHACMIACMHVCEREETCGIGSLGDGVHLNGQQLENEDDSRRIAAEAEVSSTCSMRADASAT